MFPESLEFHIAPKVNHFVDWLVISFAPFFDSVSAGILKVLLSINGFLNAVPWWVILGVVALTVWSTTKKALPTLLLTLLPFIIGVFGLWGLAMETLSVVCTAVILALLLGIPLGIFMAEIPGAAMVLKPVLDAMQTMPSFVYLIPAMMLFGLGKVPAVLATLIYALPPVIRLTALGLQQVPASVEEAAMAYGATRWQLLKEVRIPLAMPSILAGVNQTTMMALAMVVVASMIGARGTGAGGASLHQPH